MITARNFLTNIILLMMLGVVGLLFAFLHMLLKFKWLAKMILRIKSFILFGAINRLFLEAYANFTLFALLNLAHFEWFDGVETV